MMARSLGDFTPAQSEEPEELSFGWFGATIRTGPEFGDAVFSDWAEEFTNLDEDDARAGYANKVLWRRLLHEDDFDAFWTATRTHQQTSEDLGRLFASLMAAMTGRPTSRPADSSAGPASTTGNSVAASSQRAIARLEAAGRPDLALAVVRAQEPRSA
jgi:hypothetical protein